MNDPFDTISDGMVHLPDEETLLPSPVQEKKLDGLQDVVKPPEEAHSLFRHNKVNQVAEFIRGQIAKDVWKRGDILLLKDVSTAAGTSVSTVFHALKQLKREGVLNTKNKHTYVGKSTGPTSVFPKIEQKRRPGRPSNLGDLRKIPDISVRLLKLNVKEHDIIFLRAEENTTPTQVRELARQVRSVISKTHGVHRGKIGIVVTNFPFYTTKKVNDSALHIHGIRKLSKKDGLYDMERGGGMTAVIWRGGKFDIEEEK